MNGKPGHPGYESETPSLLPTATVASYRLAGHLSLSSERVPNLLGQGIARSTVLQGEPFDNDKASTPCDPCGIILVHRVSPCSYILQRGAAAPIARRLLVPVSFGCVAPEVASLDVIDDMTRGPFRPPAQRLYVVDALRLRMRIPELPVYRLTTKLTGPVIPAEYRNPAYLGVRNSPLFAPEGKAVLTPTEPGTAGSLGRSLLRHGRSPPFVSSIIPPRRCQTRKGRAPPTGDYSDG